MSAVTLHENADPVGHTTGPDMGITQSHRSSHKVGGFLEDLPKRLDRPVCLSLFQQVNRPLVTQAKKPFLGNSILSGSLYQLTLTINRPFPLGLAFLDIS